MKLKDLKSFLRYYFFLFFVKNNPYLTCQYCFPSHGNSFQSVNECRCNKQKQLDQNNNEEHKKSSGIGSGILAGAVTGGIVNIQTKSYLKNFIYLFNYFIDWNRST